MPKAISITEDIKHEVIKVKRRCVITAEHKHSVFYVQIFNESENSATSPPKRDNVFYNDNPEYTADSFSNSISFYFI